MYFFNFVTYKRVVVNLVNISKLLSFIVVTILYISYIPSTKTKTENVVYKRNLFVCKDVSHFKKY